MAMRLWRLSMCTLLAVVFLGASPAPAQDEAEKQKSHAELQALRLQRQAEIQALNEQILNAQRELEKLNAALEQQLADSKAHIAELMARREQLEAQRALKVARARYSPAEVQVRLAPAAQYRIGVVVNNKEGAKPGIAVANVLEDSPAAKADIRPGDYIQSINNIQLRDYDALASLVQAAGEQLLTLVIVRQEKPNEFYSIVKRLTPEKAPAAGGGLPPVANEATQALRLLTKARVPGINLFPSSDEVRKAKEEMDPKAFATWVQEQIGPGVDVRLGEDGVVIYLLKPQPDKSFKYYMRGPQTDDADPLKRIEERLQRLEEMVQKLVESKKDE